MQRYVHFLGIGDSEQNEGMAKLRARTHITQVESQTFFVCSEWKVRRRWINVKGIDASVMNYIR